MAIKKSELYSSLWASCDELRGGMDASQYKDYVLVLLFVKYVSDKAASQENYLLDVPKGGSFADMIALKGDKEIGDKINKIIGKLAEANDLKGVIDVADFNDADKLGKGKDMVDRLSNLVSIFDNPALNFGANRAEGDDIMGDAYEYLMRHFAIDSGKSKGQFLTPAEVSRIMAKVIGIGSAKSTTQTIYDPTCGSASLLLKAHDEARVNIGIFGQEMDNATAALARMNMILHDCPTATIWQDNTLSTPHYKNNDGSLKTFDFVVANFPFSTKAWSNGFDPEHDFYKRFEFGIPPKKNGDYAFLLHILASLKSTGKGAVIHPHGVLFRGGAEAVIRKEVVRRGLIKGIIGLPANLFYGTGIPACILVLDKENAHARKGIFIIDASKGFIKDGNKNRLRAQDIHKIVDTFHRQSEIPSYSRMVALAEISDPKNDFNLNLSRYIDSTEPEDIQDIDAHVNGGIPNRDIDALKSYWQVIPAVRATLFKKAERPGYCRVKVAPIDIKPTILGHAEFTIFNESVTKLFAKWQKANTSRLKNITKGGKPKALIEELSEDLLETFRKTPLLDAYDVYQHLMDYWAATMQDDVYMLVSDGWQAQADGKPNTDLIPQPLIVARYFVKEQTAIEQLEADRDAITRQLEELAEEHGGEDGLLADAKNDKGKLTKASIKAQLAKVNDDADATDERNLLTDYIALIEKEADTNKKVNGAIETLETKVTAKYGKLTGDEIKTLVVDDKWVTTLAAAVQSELNRVSQALTGRIRQLAERYATPLPKLTGEVATLAFRVDEHLKKMGAKWGMKPGYKKTEAGVIPEEWGVKPFADLFAFRNGVNADKSSYGQGIRFINVLEPITYSHIYGPEITGQVSLPEPVVASYAVRQGDVLFNRTSETQEEVGLAATYLGSERVVFGGFVIRGRPSDQTLDPTYSGYALRASFIRSQIISKGQGEIRANIGQQNLKLVVAPIPPLPEQRAIARALGDVDALLRALEQLIAKKRDLRQAVMQQLLTGQTRLPGFTGKWEMKKIADIASATSEKNLAVEKLPVLTCSKHLGFVDSLGFFKNQIFSNDLSAYKIIRKGQIGYPANHVEEGSIGLQNLYEVALVSPIYIVFSVGEGVNSFFLHRVLKLDSYRQKFKMATSSSIDRRGSLRWPSFSKITVVLPALPEQTAIAGVLSDMDAELAALKARLAKARDLKQGMMQELLTGRTRLI